MTSETRNFGTEFLKSSRAIGLLIPAVVIPLGWNVVVNPCHMQFTIDDVKGPMPFYYDPRLE